MEKALKKLKEDQDAKIAELNGKIEKVQKQVLSTENDVKKIGKEISDLESTDETT